MQQIYPNQSAEDCDSIENFSSLLIHFRYLILLIYFFGKSNRLGLLISLRKGLVFTEHLYLYLFAVFLVSFFQLFLYTKSILI